MPATLTMTAPHRSAASTDVNLSPAPVGERITLAEGKIIVFVNSKGGVGKSTISTLLALELAKRGYKVRFLDCDQQASSSNWLAATESRVEVSSAYDENTIYDRLPVLVKGGWVVIADGPAKRDGVNRMLMCMAHLAVVPCGPSKLEVDQMGGTVQLMHQAKNLNTIEKGVLPHGYIIPNQLQPHTILTRELQAHIKSFGLGVLPALHNRQAYKEAAGQSMTVSELAKHGVRGVGPAAKEIEDLVLAVLPLIHQQPI